MTTLNQNILLASGDYFAAGLCLTPELFDADFPATEYKTANSFEFSRFVSTEKELTYVEEDLGESRIVRLVALIKHNFSYLSKWRIRLAESREDLTAAPIFDSGWVNVFPPSYGDGELEWGEFDWGGLTSEDLVEGQNREAYYPMAETQYARFVRIDFDDEAGVGSRPDSWLQFARLWISNAYQPSLNVAYGAEVIPIDDTEVKKSRSGVRHYDPLVVKSRAISVTFENLPAKELMYRIFGLISMRLGVSKELVVLLQPLDPETFTFEALYGNLKEPGKASHTWWVRMSSQLLIEAAV